MASLAALGGYGSEEEAERAGPPPPAPSAQLLRVPADPAPPVCTLGLTLALSGGGADGGGLVVSTGAARTFVSPHAHSLSYNPRVADLYAPVSGPQHPLAGAGRGGAASAGNHPLGFVESAHLGEAAFDEQMHTFNARGFAAEPGGGPGWVGDAAAAERHAGAHVSLAERKRKSAALMAAAGEAGAAGGGGAGGPGGVWAAAAPRSAKPLADHAELTPEQAEYVAWHNARREARRKKPAEGGEAAEGEGGGGAAGGEAAAPEATTGGEKTHFHGKSLTTYAGDSWLAAPKDGKRPGGDCFLPKQWARSLAGHTQGCAAIRFFPSTGHLLLSAGMDHKAKVWDVAAGKLMRTYMGHSGALKDASFSADGARFVTASFDRDVKLWDTETGKVVQAVSAGCVANCVRLHPDRPNTLLAGLADRRVAQWDMASGDMTQEYVEHLQGVNSVTFVDEGRRFVSSSDDKTLRVWEFGIPVTIKYIADPAMHSMPSVALHPSGSFLAAQSMDNQIVVYSTKEKFRLAGKKHFAGHSTAGYACEVGFSPDGRFVLSGDGGGKVFIWDWKTSRILRTLKAHDKVCIGAEWHPLESSTVATCSWDGEIKIWT